LNYEAKAVPNVSSAPKSILKVSELYGHAFLSYSKCDAFATLLSVAFDFQHMKSPQIVSSASQEMFYGWFYIGLCERKIKKMWSFGDIGPKQVIFGAHHRCARVAKLP
jgi:hypothetical protein